jgi:acyl dehydratase
MPTYCFEDFSPGQAFALGTYEVTAAEIIDFSQRFDPQPFHVDEQAAVASPFGGLIASGWHTAAMFMRLYVDAVLVDSASHGSPGIEQLRWLEPVRPGDVLSGTFTVESVRPSQSRPGRGTVFFRGEMTNAGGTTVLSMTGRGLFGRRGHPG